MFLGDDSLSLLVGWGSILFFFIGYLLIASVHRKKELDDQVPYFFSPYVPRLISSWIFAFNGAEVLRRGRYKFRNQAFRISSNGDILVLPDHLLKELSELPTSVAVPHAAIAHDLMGRFTGMSLILTNRLHHAIVQRRLTSNLSSIIPDLEEELASAVQDCLPSCEEEWKEFSPYHTFERIVARVTAKAVVGSSLCRDVEWLECSTKYIENVFKTIIVLRFLPEWAQNIVSRLLPSYWKCSVQLRTAIAMLEPKIQDLLLIQDCQDLKSIAGSSDSCILFWLAQTAKGPYRNPKLLSYVTTVVTLGAVHTTLLRMLNVLYDLTANPDYIDQLRAEIGTAQSSGWVSASYEELPKMESMLRESQRHAPPRITGMNRIFRQPHTFQNGLTVRPGQYVCLPVYTMEHDVANIINPNVFDGLRTYRGEWFPHTSSFPSTEKGREEKAERPLFTTPSEGTHLSFGFGKSACPGRFFASFVVKALIIKLLTEYDFRFLPQQGRPKNILLHEFVFPRPWDRLMIKRRREGKAPF